MQLSYPHAVSATLDKILDVLASIKGERDQRTGQVSRLLHSGLHDVQDASKSMTLVRNDVQGIVRHLADWVCQLDASMFPGSCSTCMSQHITRFDVTSTQQHASCGVCLPNCCKARAHSRRSCTL